MMTPNEKLEWDEKLNNHMKENIKKLKLELEEELYTFPLIMKLKEINIIEEYLINRLWDLNVKRIDKNNDMDEALKYEYELSKQLREVYNNLFKVMHKLDNISNLMKKNI